jgi:hypothetical protein
MTASPRAMTAYLRRRGGGGKVRRGRRKGRAEGGAWLDPLRDQGVGMPHTQHTRPETYRDSALLSLLSLLCPFTYLAWLSMSTAAASMPSSAAEGGGGVWGGEERDGK